MIILAEPPEPTFEFANDIQRNTGKDFYLTDTQTSGIHIYTDFLPKFIAPIFESPRLTIRLLKTPMIEEHILAAVHVPSKLHRDEKDQRVIASNIIRDICDVEEERNHKRTILVGDFNMDPFEDGMLQVDALNSISSYTLANQKNGARVFYGKKYFFFYNPMWRLMGDLNSSPPGTYFHESPGSMSLYWRMFDQVLVRPNLVSNVPTKHLKIIDHDGKEHLVDQNGRPKKNLSDHLPITFRLVT